MRYMNRYFYLLLFALALFLAILFYRSSLSYYFFQDDFFEINISQASNVSEFLEFFKFRSDIIAYRPISLQNYFFISNSIFGLNPAGFRTVTYILFLSSAFLISKLIGKITSRWEIGVLTSVLWLTSAIHFMSLTWIAAAYNIIGTFFFLVTSLFFLSYVQKNQKVYYVLSVLAFVATIGSFEFSVTWPAIFGLYYFFVLKKTLSQTVRTFLPFVTIAAIYMVMRLFLIQVPQINEYAVRLSVDSAKALFWYLLWVLNVPEEFKKQVINNLVMFNPKFSGEFRPLIIRVFAGIFFFLLFSLILPTFAYFKSKININLKILGFFIIWFLLAISPVLIIPNHTFTMYLTLASVGACALFASLLVNQNNRVFTLAALGVWIFVSSTTIGFYKHNFWMINTQKTAYNFTAGMKVQFPTLPPRSVVLYPLNSTFEKQALLESQALITVYNDPTLSIYYNKEALLKDIDRLKGRPIYVYLHQ